jgi:acyl-coenzyme A synthetase/AMP-(fatty) acid ligase
MTEPEHRGEHGDAWDVENVLRMHPAVREAAVVTRAGQSRADVVLHAVVAREHSEVVSWAELIEHCREHLAASKVPFSFEAVDELPRTAEGAVDRALLRAALDLAGEEETRRR